MNSNDWFDKIDREIANGKLCGIGDNVVCCAKLKPCPQHDLGLPEPPGIEKEKPNATIIIPSSTTRGPNG